MVSGIGKPERPADGQGIGRPEIVSLNHFPDRHVIPPRNAVKGIALLNRHIIRMRAEKAAEIIAEQPDAVICAAGKQDDNWAEPD